jgi:hypothetical protein
VFASEWIMAWALATVNYPTSNKVFRAGPAR